MIGFGVPLGHPEAVPQRDMVAGQAASSTVGTPGAWDCLLSDAIA